MHTTTYTIPERDEAREAMILSAIPIPRRRQPRGQQHRIPNAAERAHRTRMLLAQCACT